MVATIFAWGCALFGAIAVMTTFYGYVMQRDRDRWRRKAEKVATNYAHRLLRYKLPGIITCEEVMELRDALLGDEADDEATGGEE